MQEISIVVDDSVDSKLLEELEKRISGGIQSLYDMGKALLEIKGGRLYRANYPNFESYCRDRWGISQIRAWQLIGHAEVIDNLSGSFDVLPTNECQSRNLQGLNPSEQARVWAEVIKTSPTPTGRAIKETIEGAKSDYLKEKPEKAPKEVKQLFNSDSPKTDKKTKAEVKRAAIEVMEADDDRVVCEQILALFLGLSDRYKKLTVDWLMARL